MATNAPSEIRLFKKTETAICESILRSLPAWFGIETAIAQYCRDIQIMDTYVAEKDGDIIGFLTLNKHNIYSAEIHVMAVRESHHRCGVGRSLVRHAEQLLSAQAVEYLQVKTLGTSKPSIAYDRTRVFYMAAGFRPIEETNLWGEENPCLVMVKHLSCGRADQSAK